MPVIPIKPSYALSTRSLSCMKGVTMCFNNSPLEYLTAFAIVFAAGVLSVLALGKYAETLKSEADRSE